MSIYNRHYMRHDFQSPSSEQWALKFLLIAMVVVFLLQNIARHWFGSLVIEDYFALNLSNLYHGFVYTLFSYGFLHSTDNPLPWHLIFNGLMLWWFGRELEFQIGSKRFLECFLLSIFTGGIVWTCIHFFVHGSAGVVGSSAGVFGLIYLFCKQRWHTEMGLLLLPLRFTGKQMFLVLLGFQVFFLLFAELPTFAASSGTAHSAHIGGVLGAFLYERFLMGKRSLFETVSSIRKTEIEPPAWQKKTASVRSVTGNKFTVNVQNRADLKAEVDRILDKINSRGFGALSDDEKQTLDRAKDSLR